ncbi:cobyric acid synthase [Desulforamulus putei]|uniref:Cobyric acid synthase n=1 Tax=Desulforamulus putei DSM 12395 TaxID=1121429 RepID=A0A1M4TXX3_9FIRM|nr:cobyric acid synthase [Desulforamulus putei]SHE49339.1 adenosylcobyric acid synthase (glutamine-hydrolysing) [Desulforamulus putei DSM 12395]
MALAKTIMIQGTSSHVGKSLLCAALCRIFKQDGFRVAPFKAQNMALNSYVTLDGGEIGRAQGAQAEAAGVTATVQMNPILLKPKQDLNAQVVVLGKPLADMSARDYRQHFLPRAVSLVKQCLEDLRRQYDVLVIEGAGSPAEVNLKDRDIVNMRTAFLAEAPVLLAADIDRGGVFASLVGTLELLEPWERQKVAGFIINKFRGDLELLRPGLEFLEQRTGIPVLGVVPYLHGHGIEEEDSVSLAGTPKNPAGAELDIAVIQLPRISNFTDFDLLGRVPGVALRFVGPADALGQPDAVILPGTKNTVADLLYLREKGLDKEIMVLAQRGVPLVGICGGYQMMGKMLYDPLGTEAGLGNVPGLGLLDIETTFAAAKQTHRCSARITCPELGWCKTEREIKGYEIHTGQVKLGEGAKPLLHITSRSGIATCLADGAVAEQGQIFGTHLHGLFDNSGLLLDWVNYLRNRKGLSPLTAGQLPVHRDEKYDRLAETVRRHLDMGTLYKIMGLGEIKA